MSSSQIPPSLKELKSIIAPTPFHEAALENDIELAEEAFSDMIPYPSDDMYPYTFTPIDLAMLPPCNYRLLTLFAQYGKRPTLSESDADRRSRFLAKQNTLRAYITLRQQHLDNDAHSFDKTVHNAFDKMSAAITEINHEDDIDGTNDDNNIDNNPEVTEDMSNDDAEKSVENDNDNNNDEIGELVEFPVEDPQLISTMEEYKKENSIDEIKDNELILPNRLILLTAIEMMEDIGYDEKQYMNKLLSRTIFIRCMKLVQDVATGALNVDNHELVRKHVQNVFSAHQTVRDELPFMNWEIAFDLGALTALASADSDNNDTTTDNTENTNSSTDADAATQ